MTYFDDETSKLNYKEFQIKLNVRCIHSFKSKLTDNKKNMIFFEFFFLKTAEKEQAATKRYFKNVYSTGAAYSRISKVKIKGVPG